MIFSANKMSVSCPRCSAPAVGFGNLTRASHSDPMLEADDGSPDDISDIVLLFLNEKEAQTVDIITLQDLIFSLSDSTVPTTLHHILTSDWTSDANRISELAMTMKNAIATCIRSVDSYVALVTELARRASSGNHLCLLVPSLMSFLALRNTSCVRFVHGLIEGRLLNVSDVVKRVLNCDFNYFAFFYFAPEIEAFNPSLFDRRLREIQGANWRFQDCFRDLNDLRKEDWRLHKELRSLDRHPWALAQYIDDDDVEGAQTFLTLNFFDVNQVVPASLFQLRGFIGVPQNPSLLEYSALFGSLRCFKYFLMAGATLTGSVGYCAIAGKNSEIIRLCEQRDCLRWDMTFLLLAIQCHKFSAFTWMVETHDIEFREIEILEAALEAANFEVFAYHMLRCKGVDLIMNHLTFVLFPRRSC